MATSERRTEPPPTRLHPSQNYLVLSLLKCRRLDDFPVSVAHGLASGELELIDLLGMAVKILTLELL